MRPDPQALAAPSAELGECPIWSAPENALWWVDLRDPRILQHDFASGQTREWAMPSEVGGMARHVSGGFVVALRTGIFMWDPDGGTLRQIRHPEADRPGFRLNETKTDPRGAFWVGSTEDPGASPAGRLYCLGTDGRLDTRQEGIAMPNALGWSPDGRTMYFADSFRRTIWRRTFDPDTGATGEPESFAAVPEGEGFPDGLAVDAEGFVWNAQIDGWRIKRYDPDGAIERVLEMPVQRPTSLCFGGEGMDVLFVTTARSRLSEEQLAAQPLAGRVLMLDPGVRGRAEPPCRIPDGHAPD